VAQEQSEQAVGRSEQVVRHSEQARERFEQVAEGLMNPQEHLEQVDSRSERLRGHREQVAKPLEQGVEDSERCKEHPEPATGCSTVWIERSCGATSALSCLVRALGRLLRWLLYRYPCALLALPSAVVPIQERSSVAAAGVCVGTRARGCRCRGPLCRYRGLGIAVQSVLVPMHRYVTGSPGRRCAATGGRRG
jgi:hypothetical protein